MFAMSRCCFWLALWGLVLPLSVQAESVNMKFRISAGAIPRRESTVKIPLQKPLPSTSQVWIKGITNQPLPGQVIAPSPGEEALVKGWLVFIVPDLPSGESREVSAAIETDVLAEGRCFVWQSPCPGQTELLWGGRPVLRYVHPTLDESTPEKRGETYKPYHHVFDPQGKILLTKGPGGLFPHHRGLFFGFNRISYGAGQTADTWHCNKGESQSHEGFERSEVGPVLGRHLCRVAWHGQDGKVFVDELRELTAWNSSRGVFLELASHLTTRVGRVKLDGDPQHAGFQFRATQKVPDKTASQTYYLRPDGRGEPGQFRNWPDHSSHVNLPWHALSFVVDDQRYTACFLDRPQNPKEARFSERDYGRFGSYFEYELTEDRPLDVRYRFWLQEGEMQVSEVANLSSDFVQPIETTLLP